MALEDQNAQVLGPSNTRSCLGCGIFTVLGLGGAAAGARLAAYLQEDLGLAFGWAGLGGFLVFVLLVVFARVLFTRLPVAPDRIIWVTGRVSGVEEHGQELRSGVPGTVAAFKNGTVRIELENSPLEEVHVNSALSASVSVYEPDTDDDEGGERYYCLYLSDASDETSETDRWFSYAGKSYPCIAVELSATDGEEAAKIISDFNAENAGTAPRPPEPAARFVNTAREAEELAAEWIRWMGWNDVSVTVATGDSGIDVVGKSSALGKVVAQVKLEGRPTGRPALQSLRGAAVGENAAHWMFFSAAGYTRTAAEWGNQVDMALFQFSRDGKIEPMNVHAQRCFGDARL